GRFEDLAVIYPVHPNPNVRFTAEALLSGKERVYLTEPVDYRTCVHLMKRSCIILTDSGGIQEEAPTF
ncbi:MAG: UDP-N-acetyl glucosamine 2-epimerase, partial [Thermoplasmata archaeon]|nr:UDP-N-acetyl glucosamine 2-epimerase [Thermoplasmata archaeon]NIY03157.1 UDP-N-acetylglucosamine 2-epimerase (non-hydrolyzing) [Thermoplasmata archaeon]